MGLIIGVIRVGVIGMLVFLNRSQLIESYHVLRNGVPKNMVKCVDRGVLRNITKTESRKFDMLVLQIKQITTFINNIVTQLLIMHLCGFYLIQNHKIPMGLFLCFR